MSFSNAIDTSNIFGYSDLNNDNHEFFKNSAYIITYAILWCLAFEISLVIVIHFKQNNFYETEHAFINFLVVVGHIVNNVLLLRANKYDFGNKFIVVELLVMILLIIQFILGSLLNKKLMKEKVTRGIFLLRLTHSYLGRLIYLSTKF